MKNLIDKYIKTIPDLFDDDIKIKIESLANSLLKSWKNNTDVYNALLKYKNDMIEREKKLEHLAKILIECPQKAN